MKVGDVMTRDVEFVGAEATVAEAAAAMGDLGVGALPIGATDDLQGILTDRDILFRVVARGLSNTEVLVGDVMTTTIFSCRQEDSISTALNLMGARNLRRLPVLDANGRVVGRPGHPRRPLAHHAAGERPDPARGAGAVGGAGIGRFTRSRAGRRSHAGCARGPSLRRAA